MKTEQKPYPKNKWLMIGILSTIFALGINFNSFAQYCNSSANSTYFSYIDEVNFENIMNTSGDNGGYADFTNLSANVTPGSSYSISLKASNQFPFTNRKNKWRVWIDFNKDGDFDDAGERIVQKKKNGTTTANISIPSSFNGTTTMRVSMSLFGYAQNCGNFSVGEVEDYTISTANCAADAGSLMANVNPYALVSGSVAISASQGTAPTIPAGYSSIYVLTSGTGLVIDQVNTSPTFTVTTAGDYTIHTLVYDPATLDLTTVVFGTTTGFDVNGLLIQGGGSICAALDVAGAPISVCTLDAGMVTSNLGDTLSICAGDGIADPFSMSNNGNGTCSYAYVITSPATEILGLSVDGNLDFEGAGEGECWVWGLSYTGNVLATIGDTVLGFGPLTDGASLLSSNYVVVQRSSVDGGSVSSNLGNSFNICAGDGNPDPFTMSNTSTSSANYAYVITNSATEVLGINTTGMLDFEGTGQGECWVWGLSYTGNVLVSVGDTVLTFGALTDECYSLSSNYVTVNRTDASNIDGASVSSNLGDTLMICAGDGQPDPFTMSNTSVGTATYAYVITSPATEVLGINTTGNLDFDGAGQGECWVWGLSFSGNVLIGVGDTVLTFGDLTDGCYELSSNYVVVQRNAPNAGTLTADTNSVCSLNGNATISATANGDDFIPTGFSNIYVLTSGAGLVIEQVSTTPSFMVTSGGLYTIHSLVYDPNTLDLTTVVFGTTTGFNVNGLLTQGGGSICASLDVAGAPIMVVSPNAGTITADADTVCGTGGMATISATPDGNDAEPSGYSTVYVLTSGSGLVIEQAGPNPIFDVMNSGSYTIHTLVYDPNTLDLNIVVPGTTTGFDVNSLLVQGGGMICASLDVAGAPIYVENPYAGSISPDNFFSCLDNGSATLTASPSGNAIVPAGYSTVYVLTRGSGLVIEQAGASPSFTVNNTGVYRIHTLVYDTNTLDLGIVVPGTTTGFDVNGLIAQGGGAICASLDVAGAPFIVLPDWICSWFYSSRTNTSYLTSIAPEQAYNELISQFQNSKNSNALNKTVLYPNPSADVVHIEYNLTEDANSVSVNIYNTEGKLVYNNEVLNGSSNNLTIDVSEFEPGLYVVNLTTNNTVEVLKLQVQ